MFLLGLFLSVYPLLQVQAPVKVTPKVDEPKKVVVQPVAEPAAPVIRKDHEGSVLVLPPLPHGTYVLTIPETGDATIGPAKTVTLVGPSPTPNPNPNPTPVTLTERAKAIKAAADKATGDPKRDETCKGLAELYRTIAKTDPAKTDIEHAANAVSQTTDFLLAHQGASSKTAWQPMRDVLSAQLNAAAQEGKSVAEFLKIIDEAASGLEASSPKAAKFATGSEELKAISPDFWAFLLKLLEMLLPLLIPKLLMLLVMFV